MNGEESIWKSLCNPHLESFKLKLTSVGQVGVSGGRDPRKQYNAMYLDQEGYAATQ